MSDRLIDNITILRNEFVIIKLILTQYIIRMLSIGICIGRGEITERVIDVVKKFPKIDESKVSDTAVFSKDLGLDSLDTVELVMNIEEEFNIEINDQDADKITSVKDAIDYIANYPFPK